MVTTPFLLCLVETSDCGHCHWSASRGTAHRPPQGKETVKERRSIAEGTGRFARRKGEQKEERRLFKLRKYVYITYELRAIIRGLKFSFSDFLFEYLISMEVYAENEKETSENEYPPRTELLSKCNGLGLMLSQTCTYTCITGALFFTE